MVISPCYDDGNEFESGLALVKKDGKFGYIDKNGNVAIDFKFDYGSDFNEDLAAVAIEDKFFYIDKNGENIFLINTLNLLIALLKD